MKKYHYVYMLSNTDPIDDRKFYIGCRSSNCIPSDDSYFSSSKEILKLIKNGKVFTKEILGVFSNREEAIKYEIELHNKYDVSNNIEFYNKHNQSSSGFDTTGIIFIDGQPIRTSDYLESGKKYHSSGKITVKDPEGKFHWVDVNDERYKSGYYTNLTKGKMPVLIGDRYENIDTEEYYKNKSKYKSSNYGKVPVVDKGGNRFLVETTDHRYISGELRYINNGKVLAKSKNGDIFYVSRKEFDELGLVGINKGLVSGEKNPNSKIIKIINSENEVVFHCKGNFKKICEENGLPFISLCRSYRNSGRKIYNTKRGRVEALKRNNEKFIGWYAICE